MSDILANDVRSQYDKAFATIRGIVEAFPEDKWLAIHGDEYYIPSRIAYHLAVYIDGQIAGGFQKPDFNATLPFGNWMEGNAQTLPAKAAFLSYLNEVIDRAQKAQANFTDEDVTAVLDPDKARFGKTQLGVHMYAMRELSDHTGELNKMLIENGAQDVWVSR